MASGEGKVCLSQSQWQQCVRRRESGSRVIAEHSLTHALTHSLHLLSPSNAPRRPFFPSLCALVASATPTKKLLALDFRPLHRHPGCTRTLVRPPPILQIHTLTSPRSLTCAPFLLLSAAPRLLAMIQYLLDYCSTVHAAAVLCHTLPDCITHPGSSPSDWRQLP